MAAWAVFFIREIDAFLASETLEAFEKRPGLRTPIYPHLLENWISCGEIMRPPSIH